MDEVWLGFKVAIGGAVGLALLAGVGLVLLSVWLDWFDDWR